MISVQQLIAVSVSLAASAVTPQNTSDLLLLTAGTAIPLTTRIRPYYTAAAIGADFGTGGLEYAAALQWFGQSPQPARLYLGRWAQTATAGQLIGSTLSAAQQLLSNFTGITSGGFSITVDALGIQHVSGLNFSGATTLPGVAAIIQVALTTATIVWNAVYSQFQITSNTTGAASAISFLTAPSSGTDISALLGCTVGSSGAFQSPGQAAETALAAANLFMNNYGTTWYALMMPSINSDSDHTAVLAAVNASSIKHFYFMTSEEGGILSSSSTTDLAYLCSQLNIPRGAGTYSATSLTDMISAAARILTVDYTQSNSAITLAWKQMPDVIPVNITDSQLQTIIAKNWNAYVATNVESGASIFFPGTTCQTGVYIDTQIGADNLAVAVLAALFNVLYTTTTKVGQSDAGMHTLVAALEGVMQQFANNGYLDGSGSAVWTGAPFGPIATGSPLPKGFAIYAPPVATQSPSARASRISVPIQVAAKLLGAVQTVNCAITVNP